MRRRCPAAAHRLGGLPRRPLGQRAAGGADGRGLPQDPQHLPLLPVEPVWLRPAGRWGRPGRDGRARPLAAGGDGGAGRALPRLVRRLRIPPRLPRPLQLLHRHLERALFRHRQGPALHLRAALARAPLPSNPAPPRPPRRSAQPALDRVAHALVRLAAPFLCFTSEEIWQHLPRAGETPASVHLAESPRREEVDAGLDADQAAAWEKLFAVRTAVLKALEQARQAKKIRSSLEAQVYLRVSGDTLGPLLRDYQGELRALFIVSSVAVGGEARPGLVNAELPGLEVGVAPAEGKKCERCWNYSPRVGTLKVHPSVCERCAPVLSALASGE